MSDSRNAHKWAEFQAKQKPVSKGQCLIMAASIQNSEYYNRVLYDNY
jgi:hypothetical protein